MTGDTHILVISDVHGDVGALRLALAAGARLGVSTTICCGDVVGPGGRDDDGVIQLLRRPDITCVSGNMDGYATRSGGLSPASRVFLAGLPTVWAAVVEGVRLVATHGVPGNQWRGLMDGEVTDRELEDLLDEAGAHVMLVGHTHRAMERVLPDGRRVLNPGALRRGGSRGGGSFAVLSLPSKRWRTDRVDPAR